MSAYSESYVTALLVQTLLYGLYMATFGVCLRWLLFNDEGWKLRGTLDWPMIIATIVIFFCNSTWLGANTQLTVESIQGVGLNFYHIYVLGAVTLVAPSVIILITDAVMIYRCWKVYNKSWRIAILPLLLWLGCLISLSLVFYYNHQIVTTFDMTWIPKSLHAHAVFYPFNAATNIYTTAAIIYRIYRDTSPCQAGGHGLKRLQHLCLVLTEAGSLYTLTTIPPFVLFLLDDGNYLTVLWTIEAVNFSMAGIAFNLVLISIGLSRATAGSGHCLQSPAPNPPNIGPKTPQAPSFILDIRGISSTGSPSKVESDMA